MKILTISLNAWNDTMATGNTFSNFFAGVSETDELANIYCRNEPVFNSLCQRYYRVTEKDIIKSLFSFCSSTCGHSFVKDCSKYEKDNGSQNNSFKQRVRNRIMGFLRNHRLGSILFFRELIWLTNIWQNNRLRGFLEDFKPDIIYMHGHNNMYMHNLLWYCQKVTNAKVVVYWGDDMYNYKGEHFIQKLYQYCLRKHLKGTIDHAQLCLGGSPLLCKEYSRIFGRPFELQIKTCVLGPARTTTFQTHPVSMVYAGNLLYGRDRMLLAIARVIKLMNKETHNFCLHIYTSSTVPESVYNELNDGVNVIMEGVKPYSEICSILDSCGLAVFVESFIEKYKKQTRLSFSTKIIDYYQASAALLAYGPDDVSSIDYLKGSKTAFVASSEEELEQILRDIVTAPSCLERMSISKREYALCNHSNPQLLKRMSALCVN